MSLNNIIKGILGDYHKQNLQREQELEDRINLIYSVIPRIKDIDMELNRTSLNLARSFLSAPPNNMNKELEQIHIRNLALQHEKIELLVSNGFKPDFLNREYLCTKCNDTGYINNEKCSCFKQKVINKLYEQSNLKELLSTENFMNFKVSLYSDKIEPQRKMSPRQNIQGILNECHNFISKIDSAKDFLLTGQPGLGKTFLCNCIAKELLDRGKIVLYQTSPNLFSVIEQHKFTNNDNPEYPLLNNKVQFIYSCDLLIIDDLGTETISSIVNTALFNIINTRMLNKKRTIISTNLSQNEIFENYSQRISSRILGSYEILEFFGEDIRLRMKYEKII